MKSRKRTLESLGDLVCGNLGSGGPGSSSEPKRFLYRSGMCITEFFAELGTDWVHDGSPRLRWVADVLAAMPAEPHGGPAQPPESFCRLIDYLMSPADALNEGPDQPNVLRRLNQVLVREGFEAFYAADGHCYLRHLGKKIVSALAANPHRPFAFAAAEAHRRAGLAAYLDRCSEGGLIEKVLLPLFRQLGFHRITAAGHKDKALEYGKDIWMRYTAPARHFLYFGIQVKRGKLDAAGMTRAGNANIEEIHHQVLMMLAHEIFDPETKRRALVDLWCAAGITGLTAGVLVLITSPGSNARRDRFGADTTSLLAPESLAASLRGFAEIAHTVVTTWQYVGAVAVGALLGLLCRRLDGGPPGPPAHWPLTACAAVAALLVSGYLCTVITYPVFQERVSAPSANRLWNDYLLVYVALLVGAGALLGMAARQRARRTGPLQAACAVLCVLVCFGPAIALLNLDANMRARAVKWDAQDRRLREGASSGVRVLSYERLAISRMLEPFSRQGHFYWPGGCVADYYRIDRVTDATRPSGRT
ncbi:DUF6056 family protein [Streptomyces sp. NPDC085927]|uniref:DUF6056 family protein n=1 Tax=Streptomyces sp. NPDC085927 TaxID=3365738 RepID=UPI0037D6D680